MKMSLIVVLVLIAVAQAQSHQKLWNTEHTTTLCALVDKPNEYSGRTVRLQAKVVSGSEFSLLRDDSCPAKENPASGKHDVVLATFSQDHYDFRSPLNKKLTKVLKRNQQAQITAVGRFEDPGKYIGHQLCCRYEFAIEELISVKDVGKSGDLRMGESER